MAQLRFSPGLLSSIREFGSTLTEAPSAQAGARGSLTGAGAAPASLGGMLARNVGGLLGRDMRTPAEKLAEAQQGINLGTYEGQLASAQARLKFETDPVKQQQIGQQILQLQSKQAQEARAKAAENRRIAEEEAKVKRKENIVSSLKSLGANDIAGYVEDTTYTPSEGAQHLGTLLRAQKVEEEDLEGQQAIVQAVGYDKQDRFSTLFGKEAKPMSTGLFNTFIREAITDADKDKALTSLRNMKQTPNVKTTIELVENGLMSSKAAGALAIKKDNMTVPKNGEFKLKDGTAVATSVVNGELRYWDTTTAEFVAPTTDNPLVPIVAKDKQVKITPASKKALKSVLDVELGILDEAQRLRYGQLSGKDAYTFNIASTHLADLRSKENNTPVEAEMQRAVVDLLDSEYYTSESGTPYVGGIMGFGQEYTPARFVMPETFSEFGITSPSRLDGPTERTQKFLTKE
jgi:hypothetical protein